LEINQQNAQFGYAVSGVGDVNNDGFDDVLVGAPYYTNGESNEGSVFLYLGTNNGVNTTAVWSFEGNQAGAGLGAAVAGAGDVNQDHFADILVGAPYFDTDVIDNGAAFLFLGSSQGINTASKITRNGPHSGSLFGLAVAGVGDVNQDGLDDSLVGAPHYTQDQENEGAAFLFFGSGQASGWMVKSNQTGALMGTAVSGTGDVNHDGYPDVIIGSPLYSDDQSHEGRVTIYLGDSRGLFTLPAWHGYGNKADTLYGKSVSTAGHLNSDHFADILVGAPDFRTSRDPVGQAFAYLGADITIIQHDVYLPIIIASP
jgi:hypothetical protein